MPLVLIPLALRELGVSGYGVWATAVSLTSLAVFADLGIGTGLMTRLGQVGNVQEDPDARSAARSYVAAAYGSLFAISVSLLAGLMLSARWLDWARLFGVHKHASARAIRDILLITFCAFAVNMFMGLVVRVQYARHRQGLANLWQLAGSVGALLAAVFCVAARAPGTVFVLSVAWAPVLINACNTVLYFSQDRVGKVLRPAVSDFDLKTARSLLHLGVRFFTVTILLTVTTQIDPLIVARTSDLAGVATFAVPLRIYALVGTISLILTLPLWPLHANAMASGDIAWVTRMTRRMTAMTTLTVGVIAGVVLLIGPMFVEVWLDGKVPFDRTLWCGMALWWIAQAATAAAFMAQNGAEVLKEQIVGYSILLISVPIKWMVGRSFGYEWIPYVGTGAYVLIIWPACFLGYRRAVLATETKRI